MSDMKPTGEGAVFFCLAPLQNDVDVFLYPLLPWTHPHEIKPAATPDLTGFGVSSCRLLLLLLLRCFRLKHKDDNNRHTFAEQQTVWSKIRRLGLTPSGAASSPEAVTVWQGRCVPRSVSGGRRDHRGRRQIVVTWGGGGGGGGERIWMPINLTKSLFPQGNSRSLPHPSSAKPNNGGVGWRYKRQVPLVLKWNQHHYWPMLADPH